MTTKLNVRDSVETTSCSQRQQVIEGQDTLLKRILRLDSGIPDDGIYIKIVMQDARSGQGLQHHSNIEKSLTLISILVQKGGEPRYFPGTFFRLFRQLPLIGNDFRLRQPGHSWTYQAKSLGTQVTSALKIARSNFRAIPQPTLSSKRKRGKRREKSLKRRAPHDSLIFPKISQSSIYET